MITWTIDFLTHDNTRPDFPRRISGMHVTTTHPEGPVYTCLYSFPFPEQEDDETQEDYEARLAAYAASYVPYENVTEEWAWSVWDERYSRESIEAHLEYLVADTETGFGFPWTE